MTALVAQDMEAVNRTIVARMESPVALIPQVATYLVASGGKRLRPVLTLASARLCGHEGEDAIGLAAAVEFIHTATLLHDDVVDESEMRRGKASANEVFGNQASVLVGDFLFARSFELMVESRSLEVLRILSHASAIIAEGEVLQLSASHDIATTEDTYLRIVGAKTAALFAAAAQVGGVVAGVPDARAEALWTYGNRLGLAFQLVDDVLDYSAVQARLGKTVGDDFQEGKITLPVVLAVAAADAEERAFWSRTLEDGDQRDGDLDHAMTVLGRHRALDATIARARAYAEEAKQVLAPFPDGAIKQALVDVADFVVDRDY
ncbi:MAG: polyprenyl synthetase family protein [Azospirillaceae bacterium]